MSNVVSDVESGSGSDSGQFGPVDADTSVGSDTDSAYLANPPSAYVGGLRARLVQDSIFFMLRDVLTNLNWLMTGRGYAPINFVTGQQDISTPVPINTLALFAEGESENDWEIGSNLGEHRQTFMIDFFAENDALSIHLTRDIADILKGRFSTAGGAHGPVVQVYDYQLDPPPAIFYVDLEQIRVDRAHNWTEPYLRNWRSISFVAVDYYDDPPLGG